MSVDSGPRYRGIVVGADPVGNAIVDVEGGCSDASCGACGLAKGCSTRNAGSHSAIVRISCRPKGAVPPPGTEVSVTSDNRGRVHASTLLFGLPVFAMVASAAIGSARELRDTLVALVALVACGLCFPIIYMVDRLMPHSRSRWKIV